MANNVWLYATPTVPLGTVDGVTVIAEHTTPTVYAWLAVQSYKSRTCAVNANIPAAAGAPTTLPSLSRLTPGGSAPLASANVYGAAPLLAVNA